MEAHEIQNISAQLRELTTRWVNYSMKQTKIQPSLSVIFLGAVYNLVSIETAPSQE
jgi:hypothetical protein